MAASGNRRTGLPRQGALELALRWLGRRSLFGKYATTFVALVVAVLVVSGGSEAWFTYSERQAEFLRALSQKADGAEHRVDEFLAAIERQVVAATELSTANLDDRRAAFAAVLDQAPPIAAMTWRDASGKEVLRVRRGDSDSGMVRTLRRTRGVAAAPVHYGAVTFTNEAPQFEMAATEAGGSSAAIVDLRSLSDILGGIRADPGVYAYIVTASGRLIAHSDPALVARAPDLGQLPQVAALAEGRKAGPFGRNLDGVPVLTASALIPQTSWSLFVEAPMHQAMSPFYDFIGRLAALLVLALVLCILAGLVLARRMTVPITALGAGAARLGRGDFTQKIDVRTGDEIEALADEFNRMAEEVQSSYAALEQRVEDRTRDLAQSVRELKALEEVGRALAASLHLAEVLATILSRSVELAGADGGTIYRFDAARQAFVLAQAHGLDPRFVAAIREVRIKTQNLLGEAAQRGAPVQVPHIAEAPNFPLRGATLRAGFQSALIVPLLGSDELFGALILERRKPGQFPANIVALMQTFADQSVLAMRNARLFQQVEDKSKQLALANEHKSLFFANMSHELRTPLNAVLGYAELLRDGIYGDLPERARQVLERIETNGRHLLGLINDVLDIAKIEAGELTLSLADYAMRNVVETVVTSTGSLAAAKGLKVETAVPADLPAGRGDERRLTQVLLNIVSNAIKFTETGGVTIKVDVADDDFVVAVTDTGAGIAPEDQARIFEAFQQVDNTITRQKGGTGLGLSISKRFIAMHGGEISVSSIPGEGSTFRIILPIRVERQSEAA